MKIWDVNSFDSPGSPDGWCGLYMYELAPRLNHACVPNVARAFTSDRHILLRAIRDINNGEELTLDYMDITGTTAVRRQRLRQKCKFLCKCQACSSMRTVTVFDVANSVFIVISHLGLQITNMYTDEEIELMSGVDIWFRELVPKLRFIESCFETVCKWDIFRGCATPQRQAEVIDKTLLRVMECLRENNQFGLDEVVFDKYALRNRARMADIARSAPQLEIATMAAVGFEGQEAAAFSSLGLI